MVKTTETEVTNFYVKLTTQNNGYFNNLIIVCSKQCNFINLTNKIVISNISICLI